MSHRIRLEIARVLYGCCIGGNTGVAIGALYHKQYDQATIFGTFATILFVGTLVMERIIILTNIKLEEFIAQRQFAELMLDKLNKGEIGVDITIKPDPPKETIQ